MKRGVLLLAGLLLSGGCVFFQNGYVEPLDYDLTPAKSEPAEDCVLHFGVIRNLSGADRRILVRQEDGTVRRDEYRRWALDPELLIQRYFYESLRGGKNSLPEVRITGALYRFEYVLTPASARFLAGFQLEMNGRKRELKCDYTVPINEKTSPVEAMSECLRRAADALRQAASGVVKEAGKK